MYNSDDMTNGKILPKRKQTNLDNVMYRGPTSGPTKVLAHHQDQGDDKVDYGRQELSSTSRMSIIHPFVDQCIQWV